jgi:V/A-type H+-transporting ATPase subunit A
MVPFKLSGNYTVKWIAPSGDYTIREVIAVLTDTNGNETEVTMYQKWPVKLPVRAYKNKTRPFRIMETGIRVIDTLNPMAEGGTGFIPVPSDAVKLYFSMLSQGRQRQIWLL